LQHYPPVSKRPLRGFFDPRRNRLKGPPRKHSTQQNVMSALPLRADMCGALVNVGYGPKADICTVPLVYLDWPSRLARRISSRAPAIPQPVAMANAVPGSILLSRQGPVWNITCNHNNPAAITKILAWR